MPGYPKVPLDIPEYEQRVRADSDGDRCFICQITERLYVLTLGSHRGNAHVHWHLAPLPPGVPYREQQYAALMHENGYLDIPEADLDALARGIRDRLQDRP